MKFYRYFFEANLNLILEDNGARAEIGQAIDNNDREALHGEAFIQDIPLLTQQLQRLENQYEVVLGTRREARRTTAWLQHRALETNNDP